MSLVWSKEADIGWGCSQTLLFQMSWRTGSDSGWQWVHAFDLNIHINCTNTVPHNLCCLFFFCFSFLAASIFSVKGIQLQKDPGKRSSVYPESCKCSRFKKKKKEGMKWEKSGILDKSMIQDRTCSLSSSSSRSSSKCLLFVVSHATVWSISRFSLHHTQIPQFQY